MNLMNLVINFHYYLDLETKMKTLTQRAIQKPTRMMNLMNLVIMTLIMIPTVIGLMTAMVIMTPIWILIVMLKHFLRPRERDSVRHWETEK